MFLRANGCQSFRFPLGDWEKDFTRHEVVGVFIPQHSSIIGRGPLLGYEILRTSSLPQYKLSLLRPSEKGRRLGVAGNCTKSDPVHRKASARIVNCEGTDSGRPKVSERRKMWIRYDLSLSSRVALTTWAAQHAESHSSISGTYFPQTQKYLLYLLLNQRNSKLSQTANCLLAFGETFHTQTFKKASAASASLLQETWWKKESWLIGSGWQEMLLFYCHCFKQISNRELRPRFCYSVDQEKEHRFQRKK